MPPNDFLINSTVGLAGMQDKATEMGIEARQKDLGQALGSHDAEAGLTLSCRCLNRAIGVT